MTTASTLKIDQAKLFAALDYDKHALATVLVLLEIMGHERVEVKFAHALLDRDVTLYRDELLKALGVE